MKNSIFKILPFILALGVLGCYKDKGNYDLIDYNQTAVSSASGRTVILGDTLKLTTNITFKYPDRDTTAFRYEWYEVDSLISTDRNLAYVPTKAGLIMYYFHVIEKETNIVNRFAWQISINSPFKGGFLMLTDKGGTSELNIVTRTQWTDEDRVVHYDYALYKDIYSSAHGEPLGTGPRGILTTAFPDYSADEILVFQDDDAVFLNGADLSKFVYLREDFEGGVYPTTAKPVGYVDGASANFVLFDNGEVYWKRNTAIMGDIHGPQFINVPMYFEGGNSFIEQFIPNQPFNSNFAYMYDSGAKRFVASYTTTGGNDYIGGKMYLTNVGTPPAGFVPLDDLGDHEMVYSIDYSNSAYYMNILRNPSTGEYIYQTYRLTQRFTSLEASEHQQEVFAGSHLLNENSAFHRLYTSSYLFFSSGSKLYFYDVNTKLVKLYHDFGGGDIAFIEADANDSSLGVATKDGSFYILGLSNQVLGSANPGDTGILYDAHGIGNIIDMKWKWGSYYDLVFRRYPT